MSNLGHWIISAIWNNNNTWDKKNYIELLTSFKPVDREGTDVDQLDGGISIISG